MWFQIEEDEAKETQKHPKKANKTLQEREKPTTCRPEETYNKNMAWKHNVENKIERQRQEQRDWQEKKETEILEEGRLREKKMFKDNEHQGPIKAWKERFDNYIKAKSADEEAELTESMLRSNQINSDRPSTRTAAE